MTYAQDDEDPLKPKKAQMPEAQTSAMPAPQVPMMEAGTLPPVRSPTLDGPGQATPAPAATTNALPPGATDMGNNLVKLANGQVVPRDHPLFTAAMNPTPAATPGAPPAPTAAPPVAPGVPAPPAGPATTVNDAFKKGLLDALNKPIGINPNDPVMKGQTDAFSLAQTRAKQRDREAMASRAGATGQMSDLASGGAFDEGLSNLEQRQGEAEAGFNSNLMGQELNKQRDDLYRYMALAGNQLSGEEQRALQEKLANLDASIRREGMAQQGGQFQQDLDLRTLLGQGQMNLGQGDLDLRRLLGQGGLNLNLLQLLSGNQQFGQNLGAQLGMFNAGRDDSNFWKMLGGGGLT